MRHVIFNQKGGVGKSSITVNLAAISAHQGQRTLIIDLDPQCNSTHYVMGDTAGEHGATIGGFYKQFLYFRLTPPSDPGKYVSATEYDNLFIIPGSPELAEIQSTLENRFKLYKLKDAIRQLETQFDAIYIDTPPAWNFYTLSALIAAQGCLIPFDCDDFSRRALYNLIENVQETRADHNAELYVEGIIVNQYQARAKLPARVVEELGKEGMPVIESKLSASIKMRESHEQAKPLIYLFPNHKLTQEYISLYEELTSNTKGSEKDIINRNAATA